MKKLDNNLSSEYRFVLGIGRSGTTLLARLIGQSDSKIKLVMEPFPRTKKIPKNDLTRPWSVLPVPESPEIENAINILRDIRTENNIIRENIIEKTIERDDEKPDFLLIKEVHGLLSFPIITASLNFRAVIIYRDLVSVLDSYFSGHKRRQRLYMLDEYNFIRDYICSDADYNFLLNGALKRTNNRIINYLKRPTILTKELYRLVSVMYIVNNFLMTWADKSSNVVSLSFEDLCLNPVDECKKILRFFNMDFTMETAERIKYMTMGNSKDYYSTWKNSEDILKKPLKYLSYGQKKRIKKLIKEF